MGDKTGHVGSVSDQSVDFDLVRSAVAELACINQLLVSLQNTSSILKDGQSLVCSADGHQILSVAKIPA